MPVISLEIGGCGAQAASRFWRLIDRSLQGDGHDGGVASHIDSKWQRAFIRSDSQQRLLARRLVIDSDPRSAPKELTSFSSHPILGLLCKSSGCGKNWASGYTLSTSSQKRKGKSTMFGQPVWNFSSKVPLEDANLHDRVTDGIRKEMEVCTGAPEFLIWHSLGGGAGGGITSTILEHLREEYPKNYVASASIGSLGAGFDPMQKINSVMSLGWLQAYVDLPMLFQLEGPTLSSKHGIESKELDLLGMSEDIAQGVAGALCPLDVDETLGGKSRIQDLVCCVSPDVRTKFSEVGSTVVSQIDGRPERNPWKKALHQITDAFPKGRQAGKSKMQILGAMIMARSNSGRLKAGTEKQIKMSDFKENLCTTDLATRFSDGVALDSKHTKKVDELGAELKEQLAKALGFDGGMLEFRRGSACVAFAPESKRKIWAGYRGGCQDAKSITLVANRCSFGDYAKKLAACGRLLCQSGAFMHWYEAQGISKDAILETIDRMEGVAEQYYISSQAL